MTDKASHPGTPATETELHARVEGLQVQIRALATAIDHLCRAVEATNPEAVEDARQSLGKVW